MAVKAQRIRKQSVEGTRVGWILQRLIVKSNDDVRQEVFVMQVLAIVSSFCRRSGYGTPYPRQDDFVAAGCFEKVVGWQSRNVWSCFYGVASYNPALVVTGGVLYQICSGYRILREREIYYIGGPAKGGVVTA